MSSHPKRNPLGPRPKKGRIEGKELAQGDLDLANGLGHLRTRRPGANDESLSTGGRASSSKFTSPSRATAGLAYNNVLLPRR
jgi:hypothetical protein